MIQIILILCVALTTYFLARISYITTYDMKDTPKRPSLVYVKKFIKKFGENFIYHLP